MHSVLITCLLHLLRISTSGLFWLYISLLSFHEKNFLVVIYELYVSVMVSAPDDCTSEVIILWKYPFYSKRFQNLLFIWDYYLRVVWNGNLIFFIWMTSFPNTFYWRIPSVLFDPWSYDCMDCFPLLWLSVT